MFACREAERLPYERTGGWTDSPGGGALEEGTVTTPQSKTGCEVPVFDSSPDKGSLGRSRASAININLKKAGR